MLSGLRIGFRRLFGLLPPAEAGESELERLPDELLEQVVLRLRIGAVVALGLCSLRLHQATSSDVVWKQLYMADLPRGRLSSGDLSWHDVYARAIRSLPKTAPVLQVLAVNDRIPHLSTAAFDRSRQRFVVFDNRIQRLQVLDHDGTQHAETRLAGVVFLAVDESSGAYLAVTKSNVGLFCIHCFDAELRVVHRLDNVPESQWWSIDLSGRPVAVTVNGAEPELVYVDLDGAMHRVCGLRKFMRLHLACDRRDAFVLTGSGSVLTLGPSGQLLSSFRCLNATWSSISPDGIVATLTCSPTGPPGRVANELLFHSWDGQLLRRCPLNECFRLPLQALAWADDCLLVMAYTNYRTEICRVL
eukprot:TRINITY_DN19457_c0_g1_i1.p1 TRINITY_DN19457_c0_g1~~TRINITY_DN19457_c0_g1_i1.p1  ORF type:complete len:359 (+),score=37.53 TRINITY_DN19457_c0_g1_i1:16-1092(+)